MTDRPHLDHITVLLAEAIRYLNIKSGGSYIDCTLGGGGHAKAILENSTPDGRLLGFDADPVAIASTFGRLKEFGRRAVMVNENFCKLQKVAEEQSYCPADGIVFDLGLSTLQLDTPERGFSFQADAPLDMRFSPRQTLTAADIVNAISEYELADLIFRNGDEPSSRRIARYIVQNRPLLTTFQLAAVVMRAVGGRRGKIHPATKTFQALRIAVNEEMDSLHSALAQSVQVLAPYGRLVVISFHSLEDRIVKDFMRQEAKGCLCPPRLPQCVCGRQPTVRLITRKVVTPSSAEVDRNPRSRSAKLRACEKLA
ncbi:MAG: 16S rRNA (cytosine(1402)-N(4))-methyltransferase RsmH [Dehalococcoidia bacterium]|nr:16S rRNA (cytosine(1402)-N(4))-methyltransferase RsmH [Dehalococcoidia bacterium]